MEAQEIARVTSDDFDKIVHKAIIDAMGIFAKQGEYTALNKADMAARLVGLGAVFHKWLVVFDQEEKERIMEMALHYEKGIKVSYREIDADKMPKA